MVPDSRQVLVLNTGSSSVKWTVLHVAEATPVADGQADWAADDRSPGARARRCPGGHAGMFGTAVGHRVVHGGSRFQRPVLVDDEVREAIESLVALAPLHNPVRVSASISPACDSPRYRTWPPSIRLSTRRCPSTPRAMPCRYGWTARYGVRRFGFHGLSVDYAATRAEVMLGRRPARRSCASCSATAVADGRSVDTMMGFTPLDGLRIASFGVRRSRLAGLSAAAGDRAGRSRARSE